MPDIQTHRFSSLFARAFGIKGSRGPQKALEDVMPVVNLHEPAIEHAFCREERAFACSVSVAAVAAQFAYVYVGAARGVLLMCDRLFVRLGTAGKVGIGIDTWGGASVFTNVTLLDGRVALGEGAAASALAKQPGLTQLSSNSASIPPGLVTAVQFDAGTTHTELPTPIVLPGWQGTTNVMPALGIVAETVNVALDVIIVGRTRSLSSDESR